MFGFFIFGFLSLTVVLGLPRSDFDSTECDSYKRLRSQRYIPRCHLRHVPDRCQQGSTHDVLD